MKDETIKALTAMICTTIIVIVCIFHGIDHLILAAGVTVVAGLGGYEVKAILEKRKKET